MKPIVTFVTLGLATIGLVSGNASLIGVANAILGFGVAIVDGLGARRGKLTTLSFFALAAGFASLGNWIVVSDVALGNTRYLGYSVPEFYLQASFLNYAGTAVILFGGWCAECLCRRTPNGILPLIDHRPAYGRFTPWIVLALAAAVFVADFFHMIPELGKLTGIMDLMPAMAVFLMARWGYEKNKRLVVLSAFVFACFISFDALLFEYLRGKVLFPWMSFVFGAYAGRPRSRTFLSVPFLAIYVITMLFFTYFSAMGLVRPEKIYGQQRIRRLVEVGQEIKAPDTEEGQNPLVRGATITKQSRIFDLVEQNGFYLGESMSYYRYVFIPRVVWPAKPIIQKGGWFAHELGLARTIGGGRHSSCINMTIPGELYLNFGWLGLTLGCAGMGFLVMLMWRATNFWQSVDNIPGIFLGFSLIKRSFGLLGPDMQSLVGYISTYLFFLAIALTTHRLWPQASAPGRSRPELPPYRHNPRRIGLHHD